MGHVEEKDGQMDRDGKGIDDWFIILSKLWAIPWAMICKVPGNVRKR